MKFSVRLFKKFNMSKKLFFIYQIKAKLDWRVGD